MPITVNEGGTLYELDTVTSNEGGTLYELDTVHSNEGGTLYEIYSSTPKKLIWNADNSADSTVKINSQSADGFTLNYTSSYQSWNNEHSIYCNPIKFKAGNTISAVFSNIIGAGSSNTYALHLASGDTIIDQIYTTPSGTITVPEDGEYFLALHAFSVTGSSTSVKYYSCSATVAISIS